MANNGKMIIYNTSKSTGAMAAAMASFMGGNDSGKKKEYEKSSQRTQPQGASARQVKQYDYTQKQGYKQNQQGKKVYKPVVKPRPLSQEEINEKKAKATFSAIDKHFSDIGEDFKKVYGGIYLIKESVPLRVYYDKADPEGIISIYNENYDFIEHVERNLSKKDVDIVLQRIFNKCKGKNNDTFTVRFNPEVGLEAKGPVSAYVYMKWVILDTIEFLLDEDTELREAMGM